MKERTMKNECYGCIHKREVPGNCHIQCVNPDPAMTGDQHGIENGWFVYPLLFDPTWKARNCANYQGENYQNTTTTEKGNTMKIYVTFGTEHVHLVGGKTYDKDCVAVVYGDCYEQCRALTMAYFGRQFCTDYMEQPDLQKYFPRGLMEVNPPPVSAEKPRKPSILDAVFSSPDTNYESLVARFEKKMPGLSDDDKEFHVTKTLGEQVMRHVLTDCAKRGVSDGAMLAAIMSECVSLMVPFAMAELGSEDEVIKDISKVAGQLAMIAIGEQKKEGRESE